MEIEEKWLAVKKHYEAAYRFAFKGGPFRFKERPDDATILDLFEKMNSSGKQFSKFYRDNPHLEDNLASLRGEVINKENR